MNPFPGILALVGELHAVPSEERGGLRKVLQRRWSDKLSGFDLVRLYEQPGARCACASCVLEFPRIEPPPVSVQSSPPGESDDQPPAGTRAPCEPLAAGGEVLAGRSEGHPHPGAGGGRLNEINLANCEKVREVPNMKTKRNKRVAPQASGLAWEKTVAGGVQAVAAALVPPAVKPACVSITFQLGPDISARIVRACDALGGLMTPTALIRSAAGIGLRDILCQVQQQGVLDGIEGMPDLRK